ncbi:hypothetical protein A9Q87_08195 [Flavobacteriales bacterium 34_180_T64]|nr:hypothetical protein A9Q87_08195 [Flavobacteriales bacterium 34_180_T64]
MSCDGRQSSKESIEKAVTEYTKNQTSSDLINYYPKQYTETSKDTLIGKQLLVKVRNYSLMHQNVLIASNKTNRSSRTDYHRVFESEISIQFATKQVYNTLITTEKFKPIHSDLFWDNATLEHVWLNQAETNSKFARFHISFINPQTNNYKLFQMVVDMEGKEQFNLIEES